jgi:hypothetical protein
MCWDDNHCLRADNFTTKETCENAYACIMPSTDPSAAHNVIDYTFTIKAACEAASSGVCSGTCGPICVSGNGQDSNCMPLSLDECSACQYGLDGCSQVTSACYIGEKECTSQEECEASGQCYNQEALLAVYFPEDARLFGSCAFPKVGEVPDLISGCTIDRITFANWCLDYSIPDPHNCSLNNGVWIRPALNATECVSNELLHHLFTNSYLTMVAGNR